MFLLELKLIKLFRCDLTKKSSQLSSHHNHCDASEHQDAMVFVNYFGGKGFVKNHHDNVHDWINLQRKQCIKEAV